MDRALLMALVIAFMLLLLGLMALGWRGRKRRQAALPLPRRLEGETGENLFETDSFYVATTAAGQPLERIAVGGLGFRARAAVVVAERGVVLALRGGHPLWIPSQEIVGTDRATWTIDRVVEPDGLVLLAWNLVDDAGETTRVDSYLRFDAPSEATAFIAAVERLLDQEPTPSAQGGIA
ncbi:hypothetical protein OH146_01005 [Salinibacterium sp. SYSU T00001]|uniref:PH-like domain-containing protein n=1 Tax=Homoserinimonas sedimenticola TaxID=2986805 RepID=UPI002235CEBE|nr:hypothetical protein [Salinibacterium sedimenticola]MCW4384346.1 hypothetical protein [Salinibacterium sedimenticola]